MSVYHLNPLKDPRWQRLVDRHPEASVFHTAGWLEALRLTYGYEPVAYTTTPPRQELSNGIAFCRIRSWLSGDRLVSLPFSDHCQPLADKHSLIELFDWIKTSRQLKQWKYIELRPLHARDVARELHLTESQAFSRQAIDLRPQLNSVFANFHKSCVQRKIRRAERERLTYEEGRSESHFRKFYQLLLLTRRRHGLPPQPRVWFRNLLRSLGDHILIRIVSREGQPIASMVTIQFKNALVYKYGCSDSRFNNLGGNSLLFWKAIQDAKSAGLSEFDLGRSETDNPGLISFKENWGASSIPLYYYRLPARQPVHLTSGWRGQLAKNVFSILPDSVLSATGRLLYRHIG